MGWTGQAEANSPLLLDRTGFVASVRIALVGAVVALVGSFLPWRAWDTPSGTLRDPGIEGDGKTVAVLGLIAAAAYLIAMWKGGREQVQVGTVASALAFVVAVWGAFDTYQDWVRPLKKLDAHAYLGVGIYLSVAGSALAVGGGLSAWRHAIRAKDPARGREY